jgi:uncharacterized membrane protein
MLSSRILILPFALQAICMAIDELYFHRRRVLAKWERMGHPLDTLTVFISLLWLILTQPNSTNLSVYAILAIFSTIFITKDEWQHQQYCAAGEHWLHALLFILHPLVFIAAAILRHANSPGEIRNFFSFEGWEINQLIVACLMILGCGIYQLLYWNFRWRTSKLTR